MEGWVVPVSDKSLSSNTGNNNEIPAKDPTQPHPFGYVAWALVGAFVGLGVLSLMTSGVVFLLAALILLVICLLLPAFRNKSAAAVVSGLGLPFLYLAWLNREGPGEVCEQTDTSVLCYDTWSPWPFLVVGLVIIAIGIVLVRLGHRKSL